MFLPAQRQNLILNRAFAGGKERLAPNCKRRVFRRARVAGLGMVRVLHFLRRLPRLFRLRAPLRQLAQRCDDLFDGRCFDPDDFIPSELS
jgi:hypothetical protein